MSWFDEQIRARRSKDDEAFDEAFIKLSSVVEGEKAFGKTMSSRQKAENALDEILDYYGVKRVAIPDSVEDISGALDYVIRPSGFMRRGVRLSEKWYKNALGAMLGETENGEPIALIPHGLGYRYFDYESGKHVGVNRKNVAKIKPDAICFYRPLPMKKLSLSDIMKYILLALGVSDYLMIAITSLLAVLLGMLTPIITNILFSNVIASGEKNLLVSSGVMLIGAAISAALITVSKSSIISRIQTKLNVSIEAATMARVLSLPPRFFRGYGSGELADRASSINALCSLLTETVLNTGLTSIFSLVYILQIMKYAPTLILPALLTSAATLAVSAVITLLRLKITRKEMPADAKLSSTVFSFFSGIQKIKLAGAEKRAFSKWANSYHEVAKLRYAPPLLIRIGSVLPPLIGIAGTIFIYAGAAVENVGTADYMAFQSAYGMLGEGIAALSGIFIAAAEIKPILEMVSPIMKELPEVSQSKRPISRISGNIELSGISFGYDESMPLIIDKLSLKIKSGQYIAIVGKTGCGKSTLVRLLLGFEKPLKGAVYYDGNDLERIDVKSLRRKIGVVIQSGRLMQGTIYENIVASAPWLNMDEAWAAAELAGIADDIRDMPMGMNTMISEGGGGISGGQRQRLLIARAVAPKPKILILDEATSALDNITQRRISEALDALKCTRIVIAHRLSTIKQCDRIVVLDKGKIIEDGNYTELTEKGGFFADLVARQRLDKDVKQ